MNGTGHYVIPFYESGEVFCRVEIGNNNSLFIKTGSSEFATGTVTIVLEYTKA